jgi:CRP-like cAMP-binding protein
MLSATQSVRDRMLLLRTLPGFVGLEDEPLSLLAEHLRVRQCRAGEVLLKLGEPIHHVYVVLEGELRWQRKGYLPTVATRQQLVGWLTLMARDPDGMDAAAQVDSLVLELPSEMLETALEDDFGLVRNSIRLGAGSLAAARSGMPAPLDKPPAVEMGVLRPQRRTLVERLIDMRQAPLFARTNVEALIALVRCMEEVRLEPDDHLWRIGEPSNHWVILEYGRLRCQNRAGQTQDIGANFVIGIMDALSQNTRSYAARAQTLVVGHRVGLDSFLGVLETNFELAREYLAFLASNVLSLQAQARVLEERP